MGINHSLCLKWETLKALICFLLSLHHFFTPPLHLYVFLGLRNLLAFPSRSLLTDLKNCTDRHLEVEPRQGGGEGNLLKTSEAYSCPSSACRDDVVTQAICAKTWEQGGESGRKAHVHLLTCSICLFFLAESVSGGLSSATVRHNNKQRQFSSSRAALWRVVRYERKNGTATSAVGQCTDHPCQREFSSISMAWIRGELQVLNSWPHVVVFLRVERAAEERQAFLVAQYISLIILFLLFTFQTFILLFCPLSIF